jgi:hypothetical protein
MEEIRKDKSGCCIIILFNYAVYTVYMQTRDDINTYAIKIWFAVRIAIGDP